MVAGMLTAEQKDKVTTIARTHLGDGLTALYLFGSLVDNVAHSTSDVDLAIVIVDKPNAQAVWNVKSEVGSLLRRDVDLIDLVRADTVTKAQVISTGELLFDRQPAVLAAFEVTVLSQYALLNEERCDIIADIIQRGSIYG